MDNNNDNRLKLPPQRRPHDLNGGFNNNDTNHHHLPPPQKQPPPYSHRHSSSSTSFKGCTTQMEPATSATTAAGATITLTIHLMFTADNPNAVGIKYGESKFTVMYRGMPLGKAVVPGFYRSAHSIIGVAVSIRTDRFQNVLDSNQTKRVWPTAPGIQNEQERKEKKTNVFDLIKSMNERKEK
ncbi:hypothetical protein ACFE04_020065 [Oxalis oulophora]